MCLAVHPPASLVGMKHRSVSRRLADLFVPRHQHRCQIVPELNQSARGQLKIKLSIEYLDYLRNRRADIVVQKGGQHDGAVADSRIRQGIGNDRLDNFSAIRTIIAMNRVFGDFGRDVLWNIFDKPGAGLLAFAEFSAAIGTFRCAMVLTMGDDWRLSAGTFVTRFGSGFLFSFFAGLFLKRSDGGRGRGGMCAIDVVCFECEGGELH